MSMSAADRKSLAEEFGLDDQYLYQCLTGRKAMKPEEAVRIERESSQRLRRWDVRPKDWHRIWPELINMEGAPPPFPSVTRSSDDTENAGDVEAALEARDVA